MKVGPESNLGPLFYCGIDPKKSGPNVAGILASEFLEPLENFWIIPRVTHSANLVHDLGEFAPGLFLPDELSDPDFKFADNGNTRTYSHSLLTLLKNPSSNHRKWIQGLSQVIRIEKESSH